MWLGGIVTHTAKYDCATASDTRRSKRQQLRFYNIIGVCFPCDGRPSLKKTSMYISFDLYFDVNEWYKK